MGKGEKAPDSPGEGPVGEAGINDPLMHFLDNKPPSLCRHIKLTSYIRRGCIINHSWVNNILSVLRLIRKWNEQLSSLAVSWCISLLEYKGNKTNKAVFS